MSECDRKRPFRLLVSRCRGRGAGEPCRAHRPNFRSCLACPRRLHSLGEMKCTRVTLNLREYCGQGYEILARTRVTGVTANAARPRGNALWTRRGMDVRERGP